MGLVSSCVGPASITRSCARSAANKRQTLLYTEYKKAILDKVSDVNVQIAESYDFF
jgi:hypothetical protein